MFYKKIKNGIKMALAGRIAEKVLLDYWTEEGYLKDMEFITKGIAIVALAENTDISEITHELIEETYYLICRNVNLVKSLAYILKEHNTIYNVHIRFGEIKYDLHATK